MPGSPVRMAVLVLLSAVLAATTSFAAGPDAVKDRIAHMKGLGAAAKAVGDQLRSGSPGPVVVKDEAAKIAAASQAMVNWFPKGSGPEAGVKTRALPLIWSDAAGFAAAQKAFGVQAAKLNAASASGDIAVTGVETKALFGACKGCHDKYRGPEV